MQPHDRATLSGFAQDWQGWLASVPGKFLWSFSGKVVLSLAPRSGSADLDILAPLGAADRWMQRKPSAAERLTPRSHSFCAPRARALAQSTTAGGWGRSALRGRVRLAWSPGRIEVGSRSDRGRIVSHLTVKLEA